MKLWVNSYIIAYNNVFCRKEQVPLRRKRKHHLISDAKLNTPKEPLKNKHVRCITPRV